MKVFHVKIPSLCDILKGLCSLFTSIFRKKSPEKEDTNEPIRIKVDNGLGGRNANISDEASLQPWTEWGDEPEQTPSANGEDADLFKDMEPEIKKPAVVVIKQNRPPLRAAHNGLPQHDLNNSMDFGHNTGATPVEVELGEWNDSPSAWEDETLDDSLIDAETSKMMKEMKRQEREQRAIEQQRRREARETQKQLRKPQPLLGVKLS